MDGAQLGTGPLVVLVSLARQGEDAPWATPDVSGSSGAPSNAVSSLWQKSIDRSRRSGVDLAAWQWARSRRRDSRRRCG